MAGPLVGGLMDESVRLYGMLQPLVAVVGLGVVEIGICVRRFYLRRRKNCFHREQVLLVLSSKISQAAADGKQLNRRVFK